MAKGQSIEKKINKLLDDYYQLVRDTYEKGAKDVADECVVKLKAVQWKTNTGKNYSKNWTVTKERWGAYTVHNKKTYRLTHLLENGHLIVNKYGVQQRKRGGGNETDPHKHIEPVYLWAIGQIQREIKDRIEREQGGIYG